MKCKKCCQEIPINSKFCPYCSETIKNNSRKSFIIIIVIVIIIFMLFTYFNFSENKQKYNATSYINTEKTDNYIKNNVDEKIVSFSIGAISSKSGFNVEKVDKKISSDDMELFYDIYNSNAENLLQNTKDILYEEFNEDYPNKSQIYLSSDVPMWVIQNASTNEYSNLTFIVISYKEPSLKNEKDAIYFTYSKKGEDYICNSIIRENYYYYNLGKNKVPRFSDMKSEEGMYNMIRKVFDYTCDEMPDTNLNIFCFTKIM